MAARKVSISLYVCLSVYVVMAVAIVDESRVVVVVECS